MTSSYSHGIKGTEEKPRAAEGLEAVEGEDWKRLEKGEIHVTAEDKKIRDLRRSFCFAHQTIENRSKEEPKVFVRADSS